MAELRNSGLGARVCDGVVDCPDFSDELYCPYCPEQHFHCGVGRECVHRDKMCDGEVDCGNGADEKGCRKYHLSKKILPLNFFFEVFRLILCSFPVLIISTLL